jgi:cellulose synthase (UDP-forming)
MTAPRFYFDQFEHRRPPPPLPHSPARELLWQFLVIVALVLGANYIAWRWMHSLNPDALWFAIPLAVAETMAYVGLLLFAFNLWRTRDVPRRPPPASIAECSDDPGAGARPVAVDVFITTYNEEEELVRLSIRDAKRSRIRIRSTCACTCWTTAAAPACARWRRKRASTTSRAATTSASRPATCATRWSRPPATSS